MTIILMMMHQNSAPTPPCPSIATNGVWFVITRPFLQSAPLPLIVMMKRGVMMVMVMLMVMVKIQKQCKSFPAQPLIWNGDAFDWLSMMLKKNYGNVKLWKHLQMSWKCFMFEILSMLSHYFWLICTIRSQECEILRTNEAMIAVIISIFLFFSIPLIYFDNYSFHLLFLIQKLS